MLYCDHCNKTTVGSFALKDVVRTIRGVKIVMPNYEVPVCSHCGATIYDDDVEAAITAKAVEIYRSQTRLLRPDAVSDLIDKVGAKELAERAKCSVSEIVNSAHGGVHSKETDVVLRRVLNELSPKTADKQPVAEVA